MSYIVFWYQVYLGIPRLQGDGLIVILSNILSYPTYPKKGLQGQAVLYVTRLNTWAWGNRLTPFLADAVNASSHSLNAVECPKNVYTRIQIRRNQKLQNATHTHR